MEKKSLPAICICLLLFANTAIFAQQNDTKKAVVHLSIWDPIGTNGKDAKNYTNIFSFNALYGLSQSEQAFTLSGLASVITENARGVQIAGLVNVIGENASGIQIAGWANVVGENAHGIQISGFANVAGESACGIQIASFANVAGEEVRGIQVSGFANVAGETVQGIQIAGFANVAGEDALGLQVSGFANVAGETAQGMQISGFTNVAGEDALGIQISGFANVAGEDALGIQIAGFANVTGETLYGLQIAGIGNRAESVEGMQIAGIFNKAKKVKGVQLGVVNIAESSDYPIGLVNLIKNGEKGVALTFDELQNLTATFRSGGRVLYGIAGLGYNFKSSKPLLVLEGGLGAHIPCTKKFKINAESIQTTLIGSPGLVTRNSLRVLPAYKITPNFEVFAGPTWNDIYIKDANPHTACLFPKHTVWTSTSEKHRLYFGYIGGLHFIF